MAVSQEQKVDFLLKKIGFTASKTGNATDATGLTGTLTPKAGFAEAIPSPLIIANTALWNESASIPATPPGSDTTQVKVYAPASALRMTVDSTVANNRAFIAYTTYNDTSSARLTNWIDTQFGPDYIIQVFYDDATDSTKKLNAGGSGNNDGWFFDYSAGVLNFNDTNVPTTVSSTNVYIVGYRYVGQTGAPTSGISTFSYLDLTVERNLDVGVQGGISTFRHNVQLLDDDRLQFGDTQDLKIYHFSANNNNFISGANNADLTLSAREVELMNQGHTSYYFKGAETGSIVYHNNTARVTTTSTGIDVNGDATFSGNVSIGGTLTYEDVVNVDSVGIVTARAGIRVTGGVIEALAGENKIPSLYAAMSNLPSAGSYHGMFAHVHATGRGYFAHAGNWLELVNREINGVVGTGTENYNVGVVTATTFVGDGDFFHIDVDGHTNLDNVSIAGVTTMSGALRIENNTLQIVGTAPTLFLRDSDNNPDYRVMNSHGSFKIFDETNGVDRFIINQNGNVSILYDLDVDGHTNLDNVNIAGVTTFAGIIEGVAGENKIPSLYANLGALPNPSTYHGMFAHVHSTAKGYFSHAGGWYELVNKETNGVVGTGTETYNIGNLVSTSSTTTSLNVVGVTTTAGLLDINAGGQANTFKVEDLTSGRIVLAGTGGELEDSNNLTFDGTNLFVGGINITGGGATSILGVDIETRNFKATGISTFVGNVQFDSTITAGGGTGSNGQYLKSVGTGVTWASFPTLRTRQTFTASAGQTSFTFTYTVNFIDVFVNGIKLTDSEFTATNGTSVVLAVGCFVGDIVELVSYNTVSTGAGGGGGSLNNIVEDTTPQLGGNLDLFNKSITGTGNVNITGIITATNFVGDGSGLTNVIGSGSGVVVKNSGSTVGTAGTINFGDNLSVTPISAGIVTVTAGIDTSQFNVNKLHVSGITTFTGITTYTESVHFRGGNYKEVWFWAHPNLPQNHMVWKSWVAGGTGGLFIPQSTIYLGENSRTQIDPHGTGSAGHLRIEQYMDDGDNPLRIFSDFTNINGSPTSSHSSRDIADFNYNDGCALYHFGNKKLQTSGIGITVTGTVVATGADINGDLDVDGHTNLDNVSIAGVVTATTLKGALQGTSGTFSSGVDITGDLDVDGHTDLDNVSVVGMITATNTSSGVGLKLIDASNKQFMAGGGGGGSPFAGSFTGHDFRIQVGGLQNAIFKYAAGATGNLELGPSSGIGITFNGSTGNAGYAGIITATKFVGDGSGLTGINADSFTVTSNNTTDETVYPVFVDGVMGSQGAETDSGLTYNPSTGNLTAIKFTGDGSGLTGITASGSGVVIKNSGSTVGTAGTINFGNNLSVSAISGGAVTITATGGSGSGISTISSVVNIADDLDVDGHTNLDNVSIAGVVTATSFVGALTGNSSSSSVATEFSVTSNNSADETVYPVFVDGVMGSQGAETDSGLTYNPSTGNLTATKFTGDGSSITNTQASVGITTNLSGSFTASAGSPSTINTFGYGSGDRVVEYTILIDYGPNFQSQKVLAMRSGSTVHSTQFAVMFSSSLLVQCDVTISSGNMLLRVTPETGVSGSMAYKVKREVM